MTWVCAALVAAVGAALAAAGGALSAYGAALWAQGEVEAALFAAASVGLDGAKLIFAAALPALWRIGARGLAWFLAPLWLALTLFSILAAFSFVSGVRAAASHGAATVAADAARLEERRGAARAALDGFTAAAEASERWRATAGCADATAQASIAFCQRYAERRAALQAAIDAIDRQLAATPAPTLAQAQAAGLGGLAAWAAPLALVVLLELGAAGCLMLAGHLAATPPDRPQRGRPLDAAPHAARALALNDEAPRVAALPPPAAPSFASAIPDAALLARAEGFSSRRQAALALAQETGLHQRTIERRLKAAAAKALRTAA